MPQLFSFFSSFFFTFLIDISSRKHRRDGWGEREINIIHYSKLLINCSHESLVSKLFSKLSPIVCAAAHLQRLIKFLIPNQKKKEPTVAWWSAWLKTCVCVCGLPSPRNLITWSVWLLEVKEERGKKCALRSTVGYTSMFAGWTLRCVVLQQKMECGAFGPGE